MMPFHTVPPDEASSDAPAQDNPSQLNVRQYFQAAAQATSRTILKAMDHIMKRCDVMVHARVTVLTNGTGNLTKTFSMDEDDKVQKQAAAKLVRGTFEVHQVQNLEQLDTLLTALKPTQAVMPIFISFPWSVPLTNLV